MKTNEKTKQKLPKIEGVSADQQKRIDHAMLALKPEERKALQKHLADKAQSNLIIMEKGAGNASLALLLISSIALEGKTLEGLRQKK